MERLSYPQKYRAADFLRGALSWDVTSETIKRTGLKLRADRERARKE
jgi:hypothetical protein